MTTKDDSGAAMDKEVEAVARVIDPVAWVMYDADEINQAGKALGAALVLRLEDSRHRARAAIRATLEAVREPTPEMLAQVEPTLDALYAGVKDEPSYELGGKSVWQAMIDKLLEGV